jgi:hypothetical protein
MMSEKIWTAEELDQLSETERDDLFRSSIVWDLDNVPPHLHDTVNRLVARAQARIQEREAGRTTP